MKRIIALLLAFTLCSVLLASCGSDTIKAKATPDNDYGVGIEVEFGEHYAPGEIIEFKIKVTNNAEELDSCYVRANSRHFVTGFIDESAKIDEDSEYLQEELGDGFTTSLYLYAKKLYDGTSGEIKVYTVGQPKVDGVDITTAVYVYYKVEDGVITFSKSPI